MKEYYSRDPMMVARKIDDELILVPVRHNIGDLQCMYTLNKVGSRIWELINGRTAEDIVSALTREFEVSPEQAEADVLEFLAQMEEIGALVKEREGS